jgi:lipopolysaccharide export system permease protein
MSFLQKFKLTLLDRYIIRKYLSTFGFVVLIFTMIACVIDYSEKADAYKRENLKFSQIFSDYIIHFIPHINMLLLPLYALITVIFFTSRMAYNSEIISILNAGVSFKRLMRPYMVAACIIASFHMFFNHIVVPKGNKKRAEFEMKYIDHNRDKGKTENVNMFLDPNTKIFIGYFRKNDSTARSFRIESYVDGNLKSVLKAENATWQRYPNVWRLQNLQKRTFDGLKETIEVNTGFIDTAVNVVPEDFVRFTNQNELFTTSELQHEITKLNQRGTGNTKPYEIEISRRTADPFTIIILTLIGMSIAARKVRGGIGFHLALGIGLGAIFIFLSKFSVTFATQPNVPAYVGVWIPNLIFACIAWYLVANAQK